MGRLVRHSWPLKLLRWAALLVVSLILVFSIGSYVRAGTPPTVSELAEYLKSNQLKVGADTFENYQQVYYLYEGSKIYMTGAPYNHTNPASSGEWITWQGYEDGTSQIYLLNILTEAHLKLTTTGQNQNPSVNGNLVMWESWENERWVIRYYDGQFSYRLTDGTASAVRPRSDGKSIIYAEQGSAGWTAKRYDLATQQTEVLATGDEADTAYPRFSRDGAVTTGIQQYYAD